MSNEGNVVLIRHADAKYEGERDNDLTKLGVDRARHVAQTFANEVDPEREVVVIWQSPAARVDQTADIIKEELIKKGVEILDRGDSGSPREIKSLADRRKSQGEAYVVVKKLQPDSSLDEHIATIMKLLDEVSDHPLNVKKFTELESERARLAGKEPDEQSVNGKIESLQKIETENSESFRRALNKVPTEELERTGFLDSKPENYADVSARFRRVLEYAYRVFQHVTPVSGKKVRLVLVGHNLAPLEILNLAGITQNAEGPVLAAYIQLQMDFENGTIDVRYDPNTSLLESETRKAPLTTSGRVLFDRTARKIRPAS